MDFTGKIRNSFLKIFGILFSFFVVLPLHAKEIERFEHIDTRAGLSQNNVLSIFCDHKGFMWFGTMDGLNRFDGHSFKIFKAEEGKSNCLTHNRISEIREDSSNIMWIKTYEGYYHYFIPGTEEFITFPVYTRSAEEKNSEITSFFEYKKSELWLGSSSSGVYFLYLDKSKQKYEYKQFLSRGISSITNNSVSFIVNDFKGNIWIGTKQGLNFLDKNEIYKKTPYFNHLYANYNFTSAVSVGNYIYFGTKSNGILIYNSEKGRFEDLDPLLSVFDKYEIRILKKSENNNSLIIGTRENGVFIYSFTTKKVKGFKEAGSETRLVFEDREGLMWVKTEKFGISRINPVSQTCTHFTLTPREVQPVVDDERPYLFEDSQNNFWIGTHGGGLALYDRKNGSFIFYRNIPNSPNTISSNFVHCIGEDKSGLIWVGTGQFNGGINKVILSNPSFQQVVQRKEIRSLADNVVRAIFQDSNGYIWMATKSGIIYIYNPDNTLFLTMESLPLNTRNLPGYNIYTITEDKDGYIWLGSKGGGIMVSTTPLKKNPEFYKNIKFYSYQNNQEDPLSLSNNHIYTIFQDDLGRMWIGTYGGGINIVQSRNAEKIQFKRISAQNSTLSSNSVRHIYEDSRKRIWVATTFGLNLLEEFSDSVKFRTFLYSPQDKFSISYNDVIHIFEDSEHHLWFGTFGGGINKLVDISSTSAKFLHFNSKQGLVNDAVFSILEDKKNHLWISTEKGISKFEPKTGKFKNFDRNSGLYSENFCENTCFLIKSGKILFGSIEGTLVIDPEQVNKSNYEPPVVLTNFQLFNRNVDFRDENSPLKGSIETTDTIILKYNQSSFSFEYSALSYFAPDQNNYRFRLENFEKEWNDIGKQRKATYTNLSPGDYYFKVMASNWDGTFNQNPRTVYIKILPPWWKSSFAYFTYFVLLVILFFVSKKLFLNYYRLQNDLKVERRVNDIKLQFFTNISHEIRTPLTLILGPIEDIKAVKNLPVTVKSKIAVMERNGKRMLRLVNQLLEFRKIQKNKMTLKVREINLSSFVNEIYSHFIPIAEHKNINFRFSCNDDDLTVFVDPNKFDSVVFNILSNAFKFTPLSKTISIDIYKVNEKYAEVAISDEGPGIPAERIGVIFERFTPLSQTTASLESTGIGLNLSYEIMKLHKGDIVVESEVNKGSCFRIKLLLGKKHFNEEDLENVNIIADEHKHPEPEEPVATIEETNGLIEIDDEKTYKILIVEDNPEIVIYLKDSLVSRFDILSAPNGKEGLASLIKFHPDIIITDIMMPEMDGIEMTKIIKENIETSHIPVIMLTAKSAIEDQIIGIESGAEGYLLKPFNTEYLLAVINNILKQREIVIKKYRDKNYSGNYDLKITPKDDEFMNCIVKIIEDNYSNPDFNVEKLVNQAPVSRTVLYNKIKGLTGMSPVDFLRLMRLQYAAGILAKSDRNVSETAYMTGFNDVKYFSKCFKEQFGVSPKDYRKIPSEN